MKIKLKNIVLTIPEDPKHISAYQYAQIRICAAKMSTLCNDLAGMRQKIADIASAIQADNKQVALEQLELLYYSAHLATTDLDAMRDCFAWIVASPAKAHQLTEAQIKSLYNDLAAQGLTQEQTETAVNFFLPKLGLN